MPGIVFQNRVWLMFVGFVVIVALRLRSVTPTTQTKVNDEMHDADLTVLVTDFEEWANNAGDTVRSICEALPGSRVVIVGRDRSPYPDPLSKTRLHRALPPGCSVLRTGLGFVPGAAISDNDLFQGRRYVLLVSGSVLFNAATGWAAVRSLHYESVRLGGIAAKVIDSEAQGSCVRGMLSIKYWTLSLTPGDSKGLGCNYPADQNSAVVMYATAAIFERLQWRVMQEDVARGLLLQAMAVGDDVPVMMQQLPTPNKMSNRGIRLNPVSPFDSPHRIEKSNRLKGVRYERLLSRFGIKLIESVAGKEWHGCLRNTPRCFGTIEDDIPDYLQENKYTPPCCLAKLRETTRYAFAVLDQAGARFWLEGGSLLGAARGGDIIPWDYDVDVGIFKEDVMKCTELAMAQKNGRYQTPEGFVWEAAPEGDFFRVQFSASNHLHVDIFPFYYDKRSGNMTKDTWMHTHRQDAPFPRRYLEPLERLSFAGIEAPVPNFHREFLTMKFGIGWEYPAH